MKIIKNIFTILFLLAILSLAIWFVYVEFFKHTLYTDNNGCHIDIYPSFNYKQEEILKAIGIIKENYPEYYDKMCNYVGVIDSTDSCDVRSTGCAYGGNRIGINRDNYETVDFLASVLVHETCHFHQGHTAKLEDYRGNMNIFLQKNESECYFEGNKFLDKIKSN